MKNNNNLQSAWEALDIVSLNQMQEAALEATATDQDVILLSPTGSGKTVGFLLPVLRRLDAEVKGVQALVMVPSRELALQIEQVFRGMRTGFKVMSAYGGHSISTELKSMSEAPAVLVGTPGRLEEHLRRESFTTDTIHTLVLDEFDKALEFGFWQDMDSIIGQLPTTNLQRILTSATQAVEIPAFVGMQDPKELNFLTEEKPKGLTLHALKAEGNDKLEALLHLLGLMNNEPALIFCNHRAAVDRIGEHLKSHELVFDSFHGGLEQDMRERALMKFRNGSVKLLLTTDLASRGLDIPEIKHIIHYQLPQSEEAYTHRNGRTARMHAEGKAYLVCSEEEEIPAYVTSQLEWLQMPELVTLPENPEWVTIYFSGGKKQKINKIDIMGLLAKKGKLSREEVGLIEIKDFASYAAIKREKLDEVLKLLKNERVKKLKLKVAEAK
ncbi:DEAD/DEAH box helicase [Limibacter armeniacum]|uniref:DEAD/DEAH box helicase n=1 Tax=Limibacter armeniacum TaxID=466084 RepID=UPI002FE5CCB8